MPPQPPRAALEIDDLFGEVDGPRHQEGLAAQDGDAAAAPAHSADLLDERSHTLEGDLLRSGTTRVGAAVGALVSKKSGQGAAIGAAIGAVAGGATNAIAKKKSLILDEHTEMVFVLSKELKFEFDEKY